MWLAHLLTISRIPLGVLFWFVAADPRWALATMATAALTDVADGRVARRARRLHPEVASDRTGAWLDPFCDKFFVLCVLSTVYVQMRPPITILLGIATRELILVPLATIYWLTPVRRSRVRYDFRAGWLGKVATVAQFAAIAAILLRHPASVVLAAVAAVAGLLAAAHYIARGVRLARGARLTSARQPA